MAVDKPNCSTCPYSDVYGNRRFCERHAPRPEMIHDDVQQPKQHAHWPVVDDTDTCGEHPKFAQWIAFIDPK
jgi:hypothetical protein